MGIKKYFLDGVTYGADDVNAVFAALTSGGVVLSGTSGLKGELEGAVAEVTSAGADRFNLDSCKVVCENGAYRVLGGCCFFDDGTCMIIDSGGYALDIVGGRINYIYAEHQSDENDIKIIVSDVRGGEGSVPLAAVSENGDITDEREFANAKVDFNCATAKRVKVQTIEDVDVRVSAPCKDWLFFKTDGLRADGIYDRIDNRGYTYHGVKDGGLRYESGQGSCDIKVDNATGEITLRDTYTRTAYLTIYSGYALDETEAQNV